MIYILDLSGRISWEIAYDTSYVACHVKSVATQIKGAEAESFFCHSE